MKARLAALCAVVLLSLAPALAALPPPSGERLVLTFAPRVETPTAAVRIADAFWWPLLIAPAEAQTVVTPAQPGVPATITTSGDTRINIGEIVAPWLQLLVGAVMSCMLALLTWATTVLNKKANLESNAAIMAMEARLRESLQSALENGAGRIIMLAGDKLSGLSLDVRSPYVKEAILGVNKAAGDALVHFGLTGDAIGKMLIDKVGVLTASNPQSSPSTPLAAVAPSLKGAAGWNGGFSRSS